MKNERRQFENELAKKIVSTPSRNDKVIVSVVLAVIFLYSGFAEFYSVPTLPFKGRLSLIRNWAYESWGMLGLAAVWWIPAMAFAAFGFVHSRWAKPEKSGLQK